ncbi:MocR-like transcription factor YczR [Nocardioides acrostichi]|uniref:PLP-dependent aminotransferase family protein n=1 Tax=Nocardioides acrostichi TaxID=2784339 RepID=A0A930UZI6_9ACTN|nr:PLP-dependent aminotransferase family protein [Nocardioides acrostichi]MBF4161116.1 PLP-dependent aminotransferase family protein [Nocardioides acrostichi]
MSAPPEVSASRVASWLRGSLDDATGPAYTILAHGLRDLVSDGRLPVGTRLPSERALTAVLPLGRSTVTRAYDLLREQGYATSSRGSGTRASLPLSRSARTDHMLVPQGDGRVGELADDGAPVVADCTNLTVPGPPGAMAAYQQALEQLPAFLAGHGYYPSGVPALRERLAQRYADRGVPTSPDQILVVNGGLAGLAVTASALAAPRDRVLIETPSYPNAIALWHRHRVRLGTTPVDASEGWDVPGLERTLLAAAGARGGGAARVAYLIPDFHNPTGSLMADADRERVAAALRRAGTVAVVDESLVDVTMLDAGGKPVAMPAPFAAHDDRTVSIGSASKAFWAGLRLGWLRAPRDLVASLVDARLTLDLASAPLEQLVLMAMLEREEEMRAIRSVELTASRDALVAALARHLPGWRCVPPSGGLALWCELPEPCATRFVRAAESHGVLLPPGPRFAPGGGHERFVRLPFARPPHVLEAIARRLAAAWEERDAEHARAAPGLPPLG